MLLRRCKMKRHKPGKTVDIKKVIVIGGRAMAEELQ